MRIYMQTPVSDDRPPRFYHLFLQQDLLGGWTLVRESGYQGGSGRANREHFDSFDEAEAALLKWRDAQLKRGFQVMFTQGQERP